jgi:hypothetical protein
MEKLAKVDPAQATRESGVKYVDGIPVFSTRRESNPVVSTIVFLLTVFAGYAGIQLYLGQPILPVSVKEMVLGKEEVVPPPPAKVRVDTNLVGYEVKIDGVTQNLFNNQFEVPAGDKPVTVVVSRVGYSTYTTKINPVSGASIVIKPELTQQRATGFLSYETVPAARLTLSQNGKVVAEFNTPIVGEKLPVGVYSAVLENSFIGFRQEQVISIEEWKTTNFRLELGSGGAGASAASPAQ